MLKDGKEYSVIKIKNTKKSINELIEILKGMFGFDVQILKYRFIDDNGFVIAIEIEDINLELFGDEI